ncbi:HAD family phosphatase, partial [bacterium]|nr:HAD family phosphatase [bacterium]
MTRFAAIIFDLDGVIVDSEDLHVQAWRALFQEIGLTDRLQLRIEDYYGKSDRMFLRDLLAHHQLDQTADELSSRKVDHLIRLLETDCPIFHGLHDLLPVLSQPSSRPPVDVVAVEDFFQLAVATQGVHGGLQRLGEVGRIGFD